MELTPHCIVEIDGRRFDSWRDSNIISSSIEQTTDKTGEGCIEFFDPDFKILDAFLGNGVKSLLAKFWYGWKSDLGNSLFVGNLARVEWSDRTTTLRFHDYSAKMKQQTKVRYIKKKSDLEILRQLAQENGLKFSAPSNFLPSEPYDSIVQSGKTNWDFALKIAGRCGLRLYVRGDTLFAVEAGKTSESVSTIVFEKDFTLLRGFNLSYKLPENKRGRLGKTEVRGRKKGGKLLKGTSQTPSGTEDIIVREDLPKQTVSLAERRAKGKANRRREYAFEHQLITLPSFRTILELRNTLTLAGMGKFFSGNYLVTDIRYDFRPGKLISEVTVGRDIKK